MAEIEGKNDQDLVGLSKTDSNHCRFLMERYQNSLFFVRRINQLPEDISI